MPNIAAIPSAIGGAKRMAACDPTVDPLIIVFLDFSGQSAGITLWYLPPRGPVFNNALHNGASFSGVHDVGCWWQPDNSYQHILYASDILNSNRINDNESVLFMSALGKLPTLYVKIRGDYWGTQYQFVDLDGWLYIGMLGGAPSQIFHWKTLGDISCGVVDCIDKANPKRLAWVPFANDNANEIARYSSDGGQTWMNMTGNWWGSPSEVTAGTRIQSSGEFQMIDAHPTFWSTEVVPEDGA